MSRRRLKFEDRILKEMMEEFNLDVDGEMGPHIMDCPPTRWP